ADIYALGRLLHEALVGSPSADDIQKPLNHCNPDVSPGLADIVHKCLAARPTDRYQHARGLAADLQRHLGDQPLRGVPNRSLRERWRKWRRRQPLALPLGLLLVVLLGAGLYAWGSAQRRKGEDLAEARAALQEGERLVEEGEFARALDRLHHGRDLAASAHGEDELLHELASAADRARRGHNAQKLHALVELLGFAVVDESLASQSARELEGRCRSLWEQRDRLLQRKGQGLGPEAERRLQTDLNDLVAIWMALRVRLVGEPDKPRARREALVMLDEAEALLGPSPVLEQERLTHAAALRMHEEVRKAEDRLAQLPPQSAWEHYSEGRSLLLAGKLDRAAAEFKGVVASSPQHFWPHFYLGVCCYRLKRYDEAVQSFGTCVAMKPRSAACYYNRGLVYLARGDTNGALRDFGSALELPSPPADAAYNRGLLHYRAGGYSAAVDDLLRTLKLNPEHTSAQKLLEKAEKALHPERK
ncbi:MAG TPA: tetratricopeptide repeat protein, partial [Gemmataceae bacterium]|nr:tetratricopeptide repeat protein [Gemmataceae bacterium]